MDIGKPYKDIIYQSYRIREFDQNIKQEELYWHCDKYDRNVLVLSGSSWSLQMDNQLPVILITGKTYHVPKETYHRLLRGTNNLILKIVELR